MTTSIDLLNTAERVAPQPTNRDASPIDWARHYAGLSLAAYIALENEVRTVSPDAQPGSRPEFGYLAALAQASMAAAIALTHYDEAAAPLLWDLTPESGALNGEWVEWLTGTLDTLGVNPADIDPRYNGADFRSPRAGEVAR